MVASDHPERNDEPDVFARIARTLEALQESFAALAQDELLSHNARSRAEDAAAALRDASSQPLTDRERGRLEEQVRALQVEVKQLEKVVGQLYDTLEQEEWPKST